VESPDVSTLEEETLPYFGNNKNALSTNRAR